MSYNEDRTGALTERIDRLFEVAYDFLAHYEPTRPAVEATLFISEERGLLFEGFIDRVRDYHASALRQSTILRVRLVKTKAETRRRIQRSRTLIEETKKRVAKQSINGAVILDPRVTNP